MVCKEFTPFRCYRCNIGVTRKENDLVRFAESKVSEDVMIVLGDELGLIHCQGNDWHFDEDGAAVICWNCLIKGLDLAFPTLSRQIRIN